MIGRGQGLNMGFEVTMGRLDVTKRLEVFVVGLSLIGVGHGGCI